MKHAMGHIIKLSLRGAQRRGNPVLFWMASLTLAMTLLLAAPAHAACVNPAGVSGEIDFNEDESVLQYCDDGSWMPMYMEHYFVNGVTFDGGSDYLTGSALTGVSDGKKMTGSFWIKRNGSFASSANIMTIGGSSNFRIFWHTTDVIRIQVSNPSATTILSMSSTVSITDSNWHHVMFSVDMSSTSNRYLYIDGSPTLTVATYTDDLLNYGGENPTISHSAGSKMHSDIADLWFDTGTYIDLSDADNRALFRDTRGKPVWLGVDGSRPLGGAAPDIFLSGPTVDWHTNKGTGGGFTEFDALADAASSPSTDPCNPALSPAIGTRCADGTVYAGISPDGNVPMFAARCDVGLTWNGSSCTGTRSVMNWHSPTHVSYVATGATSYTDGDGNTALIVTVDSDSVTGGFQVHQPAYACDTYTGSNRSDWYLPAENELAILYTNRVAIGNFTTGVTVPETYWTSTEFDNDEARRISFNGGGQTQASKSNPRGARCIRQGYNCTGPDAAAGTMLYNTDSHVMQFCDGEGWRAMGPAGDGGAGCVNPNGVEGEMVYNADYGVMQYCEGDEWIAVGKLDPCDGSPAPGTECNDGTVYAGLSPDGNVKMYTTHCDYGATWNGSACVGATGILPWNNGNSSGYTDTGADSWTTGASNTAAIVATDADSITGGTQPHQIAQYCADLVANGYNDWYLPAMDELGIMCDNYSEIGNFNRPNPGYYASSTQQGTDNNRVITFYNGNCTGGVNFKYNSWALRCVRKD